MADNGLPETAPPPIEEDVTHDDLEFNPALEPKKALAWLNLLDESEKAFEDWNDHCDKVDERFASLKWLSSIGRNKEFQLFWANCEVLKPAIYAKQPVPVVVPKFKDRRPVYQAASEVLERCATVAFDLAYINEIMLQVRDDLAVLGRGVAWCRYESGKSGSYYDHEKVCVDFKHRRDFLHSLSRCWYEVTWVAAASYLTRDEARKRFKSYSGDCYQDAEYKVDKESQELGGTDRRERAKFWEIWHKTERRVVWVAQGCEDILDEADPHLELQGFFPCPKPAYGTCQRGSLVPVPDALQYKDQLDEINLLTGRIHALADALEVKGFYPAGAGEAAEAIQTAMALKTPGVVMVPISNWAAFGGSKETIIWLPIETIAATITECVGLRKQLIEDVYQIIGLSDIMRGATDPKETLGAQRLKSEYGGSRVRDKQYELARLARDLVQITCEIICEKFDPVTIVEMSQTQLPTRQMQQQEVMQKQMQLQAQMQQMQQMASSAQMAQGSPDQAWMQLQAQAQMQPQQMAQGSPDQAQQLVAQGQQMIAAGQQEINDITARPTIEQVLAFLGNNRARAFTLDIETDSTIIADEDAEKQRRNEFMQVLGPLLQQLSQMVAADPAMAEFAGEFLKFFTAPYRTGRSLDGAIDSLVEQLEARGAQGKGDDPTVAANKTALQIEQMKNQRATEKDKADTALKAQELQMRDQQEKAKIASNENIKLMELQAKRGDAEIKLHESNLKGMQEREAHQVEMAGKAADMRLSEQKLALSQQQAQAKQADMAARQSERQAAQQFKQQQANNPFRGL